MPVIVCGREDWIEAIRLVSENLNVTDDPGLDILSDPGLDILSDPVKPKKVLSVKHMQIPSALVGSS